MNNADDRFNIINIKVNKPVRDRHCALPFGSTCTVQFDSVSTKITKDSVVQLAK
jgi:hypothetical protein